MAANMMWMLLLPLVSSSLAVVHVRSQPQHTHLRVPKSAPLVANATKVRVGVLPAFLTRMANECKCVFDGVCTCENEMKFMTCIKNACDSGKCKCEGVHFLDACNAMDTTCPEGGLQCSEDKASCPNGDFVSRPAAGVKPAPTMLPPAVEPTPTEVAPVPEIEELTPPPSTWAAEAPKMTTSQLFTFSLVYVVFGLIFAFLYYKYKVLAQRESFGEKHSSAWYTMKRIIDFKHNEFNTGLFDCFYAQELCFVSCCCPCLVWSHTSDRAKIYPLLSYWPAIAFSLLGLLIEIWTNFIGSILVAIVGALFRQGLRKQYKIAYGTAKTIALDFLIWSCCIPCAIVQEHTEEHYQATNVFT
mmetsp:Transcript_20688/g.39325  ORF Transcript_20688/g.39325 Transcript_20688/m.39325 type:complete len:357 (+) Transcript_20688:112-1182(+)